MFVACFQQHDPYNEMLISFWSVDREVSLAHVLVLHLQHATSCVAAGTNVYLSTQEANR